MGLVIGLIVALSLAAAGCLVVGLYMLVGPAWSLIATGALLFGAAAYLRAGLKPNG